MSDLLEGAAGNAPEFTVSELSGAVKRVIEGEFGLVRVRGEISRVSRPASGHLYFDLKDDRAVIASVSWKGQVARMPMRPEEGMEVIATGRLTTFPGQSKYQLIVESLEPAGAGALMAMLEKRRLALAAEGLFDAARKKPLPFLPEVIGVITSPSGAVIRDILHRLRDRFPRKVLIWPVAVQGEKCAAEVAAAIRGFNALPEGGRLPRPDLLIVARGGGSVEDLWGFNEEIVVRAAAASRIPLISAVGHETDTTLIDHAADRRAPTPTAAAEMAVPVRMELIAWVDEAGARITRALTARAAQARQRARDLGRALGRPGRLTEGPRQRFDLLGDRLALGLRGAAARKRLGFERVAHRVRPALLGDYLARERRVLADRSRPLAPLRDRVRALKQERLAGLAGRLEVARSRSLTDAARALARERGRLTGLEARLAPSLRQKLAVLSDRLARTDRLRQTLGYRETLARGFAVVRQGAHVLTTAAEAGAQSGFEIEFRDGSLAARPAGAEPPVARPGRAKPPGPEQGSLF